MNSRVRLWLGSLLFGASLATIAPAAFAQPVESLRVMTFNIQGGTSPLGQYVAAIEAADADLVGFQELGTVADEIAAELGFHHLLFSNGTGVVSRYPISQVLTGGVRLLLSPGQHVYLYPSHLPAFPYQPYQIRDGLITTEAGAISSAQTTRGIQITNRLNHAAPALATGLPTFFVGDFNEPSHLDWTQEAADAGLNFNLKVDWPTSNAIVNAGYTDAFREVRPDEVNDRGETWTPGYDGMPANEVHDRIDMVYYAGDVKPVAALNIGDDITDGNTDVEVMPYPTDHRGVVVEFDLTPGIAGDYNDDSTVDAVDYTVWRNHLDAPTEAALGFNGDGGGVTLDDYDWWKQHYGDAAPGAGAGGLAPIPEPATAGLCVAAAALLIAVRRTARMGEEF
jgi:exonuclease III